MKTKSRQADNLPKANKPTRATEVQSQEQHNSLQNLNTYVLAYEVEQLVGSTVLLRVKSALSGRPQGSRELWCC